MMKFAVLIFTLAGTLARPQSFLTRSDGAMDDGAFTSSNGRRLRVGPFVESAANTMIGGGIDTAIDWVTGRKDDKEDKAAPPPPSGPKTDVKGDKVGGNVDKGIKGSHNQSLSNKSSAVKNDNDVHQETKHTDTDVHRITETTDVSNDGTSVSGNDHKIVNF
jgi:hypothetical protein